jgi:hypothetical protein
MGSSLALGAQQVLKVSGPVLVGSRGSLTLNGGRIESGDTITFEDGAAVSGGGRIESSVLVESHTSVSPGSSAGEIVIEGDYRQHSEGELVMELGGLLPGGEYDILTITGDGQFAGGLRVQALDGFTPLPGQSFDVVTYASHSGSFSISNETGLVGLIIDPQYAATALTLLMDGLPGDANLDGVVDVADLGILASNWQTSGTWISADFDGSGFIDVADLGLLATNWQAGIGNPLGPSLNDALVHLGLPTAAVPEPAALLALLPGLAARIRRRGGRGLVYDS